MRTGAACLALLPLTLTCHGAGAAVDALLIRDVRVFDGEKVLARASVLVRGGRILAVGPGVPAPAGAEAIDGAGKTLLPGLIDAHAHPQGGALRETVVFGVTTTLDMFGDPRWAVEMRREQEAGGGLDRADLYSAGTLVTSPGGHGTEWAPIPTITSPAEARAFVDARLAEGSDYIKIVHDDNRTFGKAIPTIDAPTLKAVVDAAHQRGKLAVVHIGAVAGARAALEAGADGLVHLSPDGVLDEGTVALARRQRAFVIPTLSLNDSLCGERSGAGLVDDPHLSWYLRRAAEKQLTSRFELGRRLELAAVLASVARLRAAGVTILAGTDSPNPGTWHGVSIHRELELLVRAGLTPIEALRAATSAPAEAFRLTDRGRIAPGKRADLVLVAGDPTTDILATRAIDRVWKLGSAIDRDALRVRLPRRRRPIVLGVVGVALVAAVFLLRRALARRRSA